MLASSGKIHISDFKVSAIIGTLAWERQIEQPLVISLSYQFNPDTFNLSDDISDAVDYAAVCDSITEFTRHSQYQLIESFTYQLASMLQTKYTLSWLSLEVKKPSAIADARCISASVELSM